jgi:predicted Zn-dependent protease
MLSFSRDYEREADRVGQQLMYKAGFDAHAMPEFFQRMQDSYKFNTNDALAFLQTHPVTVERLSEAEARANQLPVKMRQDSVDFLLVREKCRVRQIAPEEALKFYASTIQTRRYVSLDAQLYGLALAQFMNKSVVRSVESLNKVTNPHYQGHPIVIGLRARQLIAMRNFNLADKLYDQALANFPNHKSLWMGQLEFLLGIKNYSKAAGRVDILTQNFPKDPDVWDQYAMLYADDRYDNPLRYHYGLGSEYYVLGSYKSALDQYQTALKSKAKQPGDEAILELVSSRIPDVMRNLK